MTKKNDLTTGPIFKRLMYLAVPIIGSQTIQMIYNLMDMFWMGRIGSGEVAATGAAGLYLWLSVGIMLLGSTGASIGVSQAVGSGDKEKAKSYTNTSLLITLISGIFVMISVVLFRSQMTGFFSFKENNIVALTENYLFIVALGIPLLYFSSTLGSIFTATGNSHTPFICNSIGMIINMILDPIFIFTLKLGVIGAAYTNIIGQAFSCITLFAILKKGKKRPFDSIKLFSFSSWEEIKWMLKKTLPICTESMLFTFLVMVTSKREAYFGTDMMALSRVGSQIESLTWLVGGAFGTALVSFIGQNYGAKRWDRIKTIYKIATITMICYGAFVSFLLAVPGKYIFGLFLPDPVLIEKSVSYLRITAISQIPMCLETVASNTFRGLSRTGPPAIVNITCNILRAPLAYLLSAEFMKLGLYGVWIAIVLTTCLKGIWSYSWYLVSEYKRKQNLLVKE